MNEQRSDVPASVARVTAALEAAGASGRPRVLPASTRTAVDAAAALGCDVGAIANSLVFLADDRPLLVMTSGAHRVDTAALASGSASAASVARIPTTSARPPGR